MIIESVWVTTMASVLLVSAVSLVGLFALGLSETKLRPILTYLVSFSAGALLGDVFLHVLPELAEISLGPREGVYFLVGIAIFFVLERSILWHRHHNDHDETVHSMVYLTMFGDSLHNFIDGMIIAASFLVNPALGVASTIAVIFHEIPQEIGQFAILLHGGWSKSKALWYNFLSALTAVLGAVIVLIFGRALNPTLLLSLAGASFIYIALSDLVPELHEEKDTKRSIIQFVWFIGGMAIMGALLFLE